MASGSSRGGKRAMDEKPCAAVLEQELLEVLLARGTFEGPPSSVTTTETSERRLFFHLELLNENEDRRESTCRFAQFAKLVEAEAADAEPSTSEDEGSESAAEEGCGRGVFEGEVEKALDELDREAEERRLLIGVLGLLQNGWTRAGGGEGKRAVDRSQREMRERSARRRHEEGKEAYLSVHSDPCIHPDVFSASLAE
jgi:hypothetical protein